MTNTKNKRLIESVSFTDVQFVEAADGNPRMIKGVALLGGVAKRGKNSYSYPVRTMETAVRAGKYDNCRCFINHPTDKEMNSGRRDLNSLAGMVKNPRVESGKIKGDVMLLPDQFGNKFYDIAKLMPEAASCSHIADGKLKREGNNMFVEEIKEVLSVDLVVQGATTQNVFESKDYQKGNTMEYSDITISDLRIKCPDIVKTLIEEGHKSRDDEVKKLTESETELKGKIDEHDVKEKVAVRKADVATLLEESKLPKTAKTDVFREQLIAIDSDGDDFKKEAKKLIEDRATVIGGVKNMGGGGGNKNNSNDNSGDFESGLDALHSDD